MKFFAIILISIPTLIFGDMQIKIDEKGSPLLDQFSEEGFIDCVFVIRNLEEKENSYSFYMAASFNETEVGMNVEVVKGVESGFNQDMQLIQDHVYHKGVIFFRSGDESDFLIAVLASLYGMENKNRKMVEKETYTTIALHQGEIDMAKEPIKLKIFGKDSDNNTEDEYNESFFNLDLANGFVFWNEKDPDYREPLIKGLSK